MRIVHEVSNDIAGLLRREIVATVNLFNLLSLLLGDFFRLLLIAGTAATHKWQHDGRYQNMPSLKVAQSNMLLRIAGCACAFMTRHA
jgi:hypothetical protein